MVPRQGWGDTGKEEERASPGLLVYIGENRTPGNRLVLRPLSKGPWKEA